MMTDFERLSALDSNFLYWDAETTPVNMGNVCVFEGGPLFDDGVFRLREVREAIAARLARVPRYTMKLHPGVRFLTHPVLVDDPDFDITNHVKLIALPKPGTDAQLKEVFARVHEGTMDRSRPLWEIWFVEGLASGNVGMIQKIHHAPFDGQSTVDILEALLDPEPVAASSREPARVPRPAPASWEVLAQHVGHRIAKAWDIAVSGPHAPITPARMLADLRALATVWALGLSPRSPLNAMNTRSRRFDWLHTDIDVVRRIRALVPASTLNDVMLACVAGGVRELLREAGQDPDTWKLRVFVPVSMRSADERDAQGGNRLSAIMAPFHVDIADDLERMRTIQATMATLKGSPQPLGFSLLLDWVELLPPALLEAIGPAVRNARHFMNMTVTNVVGPRREQYLLGAKMLELNPMVPIANQLSLNIAVESYAGRLSVGLSADGVLIPDLEPFKSGFRQALDTLHSSAVDDTTRPDSGLKGQSREARRTRRRPPCVT